MNTMGTKKQMSDTEKYMEKFHVEILEILKSNFPEGSYTLNYLNLDHKLFKVSFKKEPDTARQLEGVLMTNIQEWYPVTSVVNSDFIEFQLIPVKESAITFLKNSYEFSENVDLFKQELFKTLPEYIPKYIFNKFLKLCLNYNE